MEAIRRRFRFYQDIYGREPAKIWLYSLRDSVARERIMACLLKASDGNFGDHKSVGDGVSEMRLHFGPGYRLYYAIAENNELLLLLVGGDKSTQESDIQNAKKYWQETKNA